MALPTTISGTLLPQRNYYMGPFISGGNVYVVLCDTGASPRQLEMWKATDPTSSFTQQDTAGESTTNGDIAAWAYLDGTTIHIATAHNADDGGNGIIRYHAFSTSSDTWTTVDQTIEGGIKGQSANSSSVSIAIRSDGDRIVLYGGDPDTDMGTDFDRIDYARWEGVSWTAGIDVGGTSPAGQSRVGASVIRGSGDNMHFFWGNSGDGTSNGRTLDPTANTLSTTRSATFAGVLAHGFRNGVSYDDSGTQRVIALFADIGPDLYAWRFTEDGSGDLAASPGSTVIEDGTSTNPRQVNDTPVASAALDVSTMYVLWSNVADSDLYRDSAIAPQTTWGTDIEFLDAVTINRISVNIYDRSGTKLAMVYDNGGTIQYNEIDLAVARPPLVRLPRHAPFRAAFY